MTFWTNREVATLRQFYPAMRMSELLAKLPRRSRSSIRKKAADISLASMPVDAEQLRWGLAAQSYFLDRAARGVIAAQDRFRA